MRDLLKAIGLSKADVERITASMRPKPAAVPSCKYPREVIQRAVEMQEGGSTFAAIAEETGLPIGSVGHALEVGKGMLL